MAIARRRPARLLGDGRLALKGDWLPLLLLVGIFAIRYAQGIALGIDPALAANTAFSLAGMVAAGLFAAMMVARVLGQLPAEVFRRLVPAAALSARDRDRA